MQATSKERILKKVRKALIQQSPEKYSGLNFKKNVYSTSAYTDKGLDIIFAEELTNISGKFIFCENGAQAVDTLTSMRTENGWNNIFCFQQELKDILKKEDFDFKDDIKAIDTMDVGITSCEYLIARTGSVMISSAQSTGRRMSVYPPTHVVFAYTSQLVMYLKDALDGMSARYTKGLPSMITTISGPSRTADIEKTLILGAHGPKELYVFMIDDNLKSQ
ncbi:MAG TPA: hypothetical protein EYN51_02910 [Flavobacteriales bacterium]|nr:hypothetical protein [Flavobacteriales bacterium]HIA11871.1 hypothetical protein [Flavobacteriales bacterium]